MRGVTNLQTQTYQQLTTCQVSGNLYSRSHLLAMLSNVAFEPRHTGHMVIKINSNLSKATSANESEVEVYVKKNPTLGLLMQQFALATPISKQTSNNCESYLSCL
jgi:hypothetical protein